MERKKNRALFDRLFPYLMVLPGVILFTCFVLMPFFYGFYTSLFRWDGIGDMKWIGGNNYLFAIEDEIFRSSLINTFVYAFWVTFLKNALGFLIAVLLVRQSRFKALFRTAVYMPVTFSYVVIGVLWSWIYNPNFGILNQLLNLIGMPGLIQSWLGDPSIALYSIIWVDVWKWVGFHMILYLSGLQAIPVEYYEAVSIDGANAFQRFWHITVPQLNSIIVLNVLLSITGAFVSNYNLVNVMTGGGPFNSTEVALTYAVKTAFHFNAVGKSNAMSMILFLFVFTFGFLQLKVMTKDDVYG